MTTPKPPQDPYDPPRNETEIESYRRWLRNSDAVILLMLEVYNGHTEHLPDSVKEVVRLVDKTPHPDDGYGVTYQNATEHTGQPTYLRIYPGSQVYEFITNANDTFFPTDTPEDTAEYLSQLRLLLHTRQAAKDVLNEAHRKTEPLEYNYDTAKSEAYDHQQTATPQQRQAQREAGL